MKHEDIVKTLLVQKDQTDKSGEKLSELKKYVSDISDDEKNARQNLETFDNKVDQMFMSLGINRDELDLDTVESKVALSEKEEQEISEKLPQISFVDVIGKNDFDNWDSYMSKINVYAESNNIDLTKDPFESLLSSKQRADIEKRFKEDYTIKKCNCDKYDYYIAATCGAIGGLIDAFFVGIPRTSSLGKFTDEQSNKIVQKFSSACGWKGPKEGSDPTKSAIGFLERKFKVNYDHRHAGDVGIKGFKMSTKNHHIKSLSHSPDIIGLFFSILNQFTNTASFVDGGKIITIKTEPFELQGNNFISKIYCGFINWLGHLISDMAGSSGAAGRGSGIPIPFYGLLQFINFGSFGQHNQTFAKIAVQVFEQGYDLRYGAALAIPVAITEVLIRIMWTVKSHFYHKQDWKQSIPFGNIPELRRMLLVGHGTLCLVDISDAALRSGGEPVQMLLRMNFIGWVRFGLLGFKEIRIIYKSNAIDTELIDADLEKTYKSLIKYNR